MAPSPPPTASLFPPFLDLLIRAVNATATNGTTTNTSSTDTTTTTSRPSIYKVIGLILAVSSGLFIGTSFVLKKVGLLKSNVKYNEAAGEGYGYLKNLWWWSGMTLMIVGEICNFVAYAFTDAILVTPMGALSVVVTTILSAIFLKERLSFVGKVGCFLCIIGSVIIVVSAPDQSSVANIQEMKDYVIAPGFLSYAGVIVLGCAFLAFWAGPRYGKKSMLVYISICSLIGGLSVVATQGLGAAIVEEASGNHSQLKYWFFWVLLVLVITTLLTEIVFLNKALNLFNAALVTPTYYVYFTSSTILTTIVLFKGLKGATAADWVNIIMGFFVICSGVVLLQLSKSAKDVPDAAIFKGDLDQLRTVAEQEELESEPKADAIRGAAALLRSISKSRAKREADEARRIQEEHLEPIGENEQVEWDGIRRRKTVISTRSRSVHSDSTRILHPPLGMSHFPEEHSDEDGHSHNPEDDLGIFPNLRNRTLSILHPDRNRSVRGHLTSHNMPSNEMQAIPPLPTNDKNSSIADYAYNTRQQPPMYGLPSQSIGMGGLHNQDTTYKSPTQATIQWANPPRSFETSPTSSRAASPYGSGARATAPPPFQPPAPPPHVHRSPDRGDNQKRQFSFQNVFSRRRSDASPSPGSSLRVTKGKGVLGRNHPAAPLTTEEERLGLVTKDGRMSLVGATRAEHEAGGGEEGGAELGSDEEIQEEPEEMLYVERRRGLGGGAGYEDDDDDIGYARVRGRDIDDGGGGGTAFV